MRVVPINCIKANSVLAKTIYNKRGNVLLKKGVELTESLLEKILENGIQMVYINDQYTEGEIEDIIKPELKQKAIEAIKDTYSQAIVSVQSELKSASTLKQKNNAKLKDNYIQNINKLSATLVEEILSKTSTMINLVDIKTMDNYTYEHSLNVAVLSLVLGVQMKLNQKDLVDLCVGAILHDIGKVMIDPNILMKLNRTEEEENVYKSHADEGYKYLKEYYHLSGRCRIIAFQHHERWDGLGFPRGTAEDHIHKFARIVAITDTYDKLTSSPYQENVVPPNEAIEYIMASGGQHFDFELANVFVRKVNPYPVGTLVLLSNGKKAVVSADNINYPLRPVLKVLKIEGQDEQVINLMQKTDLIIEKIIYEVE